MASRQPRLHLAPYGARTYSIFDLARRFGQDARSVRWLAKYLSGLIKSHGFPSPFPVLRGDAILTDTNGNSRWAISPVDQWFLDFMPPDVATALDAAEAREAAGVMDERASRLGLRLVERNGL